MADRMHILLAGLQCLCHDIAATVRTAVREWRRLRWLRQYGNPDACPF